MQRGPRGARDRKRTWPPAGGEPPGAGGSRMQIGVVGGSVCTRREADLAEAVGAEIARRGAVLVCGGLGGVMEHASRGARNAGGVVIGILPGPSPDDANPHVTAAVATGMGEARNAIVVRSSHCIIAVGGAWGTLSEIALAMAMGLPVVSLCSWAPRREGVQPGVLVATEAAEAVEKALEAVGGGSVGRPSP